MNKQRKLRIGVYAGTFDPVHVGHVAFALQAIKAAGLDSVIFLPERVPRNKNPSEHYAHRVAMLKNAIKPHPDLSVIELVDKHFTIKRTLPELQKILPDAALIMLAGSDVIRHMPEWPNIEILLRDCELVVGTRRRDQPEDIRKIIAGWPQQPVKLHIIRSHAPNVSSTDVRGAIGKQSHTHGLLSSVHAYAKANWLYVSIDNALRKKS
jgi:nicotinate-nucleotide adenylyltransferase